MDETNITTRPKASPALAKAQLQPLASLGWSVPLTMLGCVEDGPAWSLWLPILFLPVAHLTSSRARLGG
eukprot:3544765-Karenia_brevis.AAC.1